MQAIDRDLNYSEPASLKLKVVPPWYLNGWIAFPSGGAILALLLSSLFFGLRYYTQRQSVRAYERTAAQELQDANQVQMSLMPGVAPPIDGVEIAGKCVPANTVSGDFFDYLEGKGKNDIGLVVADVTGKAMKGAMNAVMADGVLRMAAKAQEQLSPASLMAELNDVLKGSMEWGMNITMVIGVIDTESKTLTLANAAHHAHPLLRREGLVQVLKTGGLPLGMKAGISYSEERINLQSGDVLILMTDGIIEAKGNEENNYSESGRLEQTIMKFTPDMPAEAMVDAVINDAMDFGGDRTQRDDDMTVVVAKIQ
ncbi:serine/threonine-protein phosphatase [bacterium]|nr:serine/threonine-protein phosphatase [bacterium]